MRQRKSKLFSQLLTGSAFASMMLLLSILTMQSCHKNNDSGSGNNGNNNSSIVETATMKYVPDSVFRAYLKANICPDAFDKSGKLIDITNPEVANFNGTMTLDSSYMVSSLTGIKYFPKTTKLIVNYSSLDSLDLSASIALDTLRLINNIDLQYINVSGCNVMRYIRVATAPPATLDLSNLPQLNYVSLINLARLSSLNLANDNNLEHLITYSLTAMTSIDVSKNPNLLRLFLQVAYNINAIDITHNPKLKMLMVTYGYKLTNTIDFSKNPDLRSVTLDDCPVPSVDFSKNPNLYLFSTVYNSAITNLNLAANPNVHLLSLDACTKLQSLDLRTQTGWDFYYRNSDRNSISDADFYEKYKDAYGFVSPVQTPDFSGHITATRKGVNGATQDIFGGLRLPQYLDASGLSLQTLKINDAAKDNYSIVMARRVFPSMTPVLETVYSQTDTSSIICHDYSPEKSTCTTP